MRRQHKRKTETEGDSEEIEMLSNYLSQRRKAKRRKANLERRLFEIRKDIERPISAARYTPINSPTKSGDGCASLTFRTSDCELKIYEQAEQATKYLLRVMDIMDYLDKSSDEREALELYYIDGHTWEYAAEKMEISRSQVFNLRRSGLEKLLTFDRVREIVREYKSQGNH